MRCGGLSKATETPLSSVTEIGVSARMAKEKKSKNKATPIVR
jgi:hypothetical protein